MSHSWIFTILLLNLCVIWSFWPPDVLRNFYGICSDMFLQMTDVFIISAHYLLHKMWGLYFLFSLNVHCFLTIYALTFIFRLPSILKCVPNFAVALFATYSYASNFICMLIYFCVSTTLKRQKHWLLLMQKYRLYFQYICHYHCLLCIQKHKVYFLHICNI